MSLIYDAIKLSVSEEDYLQQLAAEEMLPKKESWQGKEKKERYKLKINKWKKYYFPSTKQIAAA